MKKTLCIILTALLLISSASCGKTEVPDDTETAKEDVTVTAEAESEIEETTKAKQNDTEEVTEDTAEDTDDVTEDTESADSGEETEVSLIGKWVCGDDRIIFNEDGSCTLCEFGRTQDLEYEIDGDRIIFYEGNNVADDKSFSSKGGKLIITDEGGTRIFTKG